MTTELPAHPSPAPGAEPTAEPAPSSGSWRGILAEAVAVVVAFAVAGAIGGWIWERWVTPPEGVVNDGKWRLGYRIRGDFLVSDYASLGHGFGVIGTFVVIGLVGGLLLGVAAALLCRRSELATLAAVLVGGVLAAVVCYRVGLALGPSDPDVAAASAKNGTMLVGDLAITELSPFVAWSVTALAALAFLYFLIVPTPYGRPARPVRAPRHAAAGAAGGDAAVASDSGHPDGSEGTASGTPPS